MSAAAAPAAPASEVVRIVSDLHALIDARMQEHPVLAGIFFYVFFRVGRLRDHLVRFFARVAAGTTPHIRKPLSEEAALLAAHKSRRRRRNPTQWPTKYRALADMLGRHEAADFADRLRALLAKPEAVVFIVANPGVGRYLRPLCRALGVELIPELRLKRRPRKPKPKAAPSLAPLGRPPKTPAAAPSTFAAMDEGELTLAERSRRSIARRFGGIWREV